METQTNIIKQQLDNELSEILAEEDHKIHLDIEYVALYLNELKSRTDISFDAIAKKADVSVSTVKKIFKGDIDNPGIITISRIVYALGGSMDELLNPDKTQDELKSASIAALQESYECQMKIIKSAYDEQVENIRKHYAEHIDEVRDFYEKRISDKEAIIELYSKMFEMQLKTAN